MYLLDTDHLSIIQRGGKAASPLFARLASLGADEISATIISYEEQTRGWLSYVAKAQTIEAQIEAYSQLQQHLENYRNIPIVDFDKKSALEFQRLRKIYPRLGTMDLKIASITIANDATLLTRNLSDFGKILELRFEDWTV